MKKLFLNVLLIGCIGVIMPSCSSTKTVYVKFTPKQDDIYTKPALTKLLAKKSKPSVIVRVPNQSSTISNSNVISLSSTYNSIEKEFLKQNFIVRDRSIFEKISNQNQQMDYAKLRDLTDVDILLELVDVSSVDFSTNVFYDKKGKPSTMKMSKTVQGLKVEFKVVTLENNEVSGNYTFYWTPCTNGCEYVYYNNMGLYPPNYNSLFKTSEASQNIAPYEAISSNGWSDFISTATKRMINEMMSQQGGQLSKSK